MKGSGSNMVEILEEKIKELEEALKKKEVEWEREKVYLMKAVEEAREHVKSYQKKVKELERELSERERFYEKERERVVAVWTVKALISFLVGLTIGGIFL